MIFRNSSRFCQVILGFALGLWLTAPARAFPVEVISDTSPAAIQGLIESTKQTLAQLQLVASSEGGRLAQVAEYIKTALRWVETVNHYTNVIIQDVRRFTTLKGIMGVVEKQLGLNDDTLKAMADLGQVVRGIFTLKNQFQALITTRIRMIRDIEQRARNGIFDPQADLDDLDEYLRSGIGRRAQDVIANRERLAAFDNDIERWTFDLGQLRAHRVALVKEQEQVKAHLERELQNQAGLRETGANPDGASTTTFEGRHSVSSEAIDADRQTLHQIEEQLLEIDKQIRELIEKLTQRYKEYHQKFDEAKVTADSWQKAQEGWDEFMEVKEQAIESAIDQYGQAPVPQP